MTRGSKTWIALLRGVNVGGTNKLPMKELASELEAIGFENVRTYIQSGNVVFRSPGAKKEVASLSAAAIAASIAQSIKNKFGFQPGVIVITKEELIRAAASNPYAEAAKELEGRALHLFFLDIPPKDIPKKMDARLPPPSQDWLPARAGSPFAGRGSHPLNN